MTGMTKGDKNGQVVEPMPINLRVWTGVSGTISAAHESLDGTLHGHTWEVKAWWTDGRDALAAKATLANCLSSFDHTLLPAELARGEALAEAVLVYLGCKAVDISRPLEGIFARAEISRLSSDERIA